MSLKNKINKLIQDHEAEISASYLTETIELNLCYLSAIGYLCNSTNDDGSDKRPLDIYLVIDDDVFKEVPRLYCNLEDEIMEYVNDDPEHFRENAIVLADHLKKLSDKIIKAVN
tara:strand:- start:163 stop:504 length:342 start_codon:yes stop_codon:yes gene_type:complete